MIDVSHVRVETVFICPFCGAKAGILKDPAGLVHDYPACGTFINTDTDEYLRAVNEHTRSLS